MMNTQLMSQRVKSAEVALAYVQNILQKYSQKYIGDTLYIEQQTLVIDFEAVHISTVWEAVHEISWNMDIYELSYHNVYGKMFCKFKVNLAKKVEHDRENLLQTPN